MLPLFALVVVSLERYWSAQIPWGQLSLRAYRVGIWQEATARKAIVDSLVLGLVVGTIGILDRRARLALRRPAEQRRDARARRRDQVPGDALAHRDRGRLRARARRQAVQPRRDGR